MEDYFVKSEEGSINFSNIVIKSSSNLNFSLLLVGYFDSFNTGKSNYYHEIEYHFFANHCTFGEIRHMYKKNNTVDKVNKEQNYDYSLKYLAITLIMSKCKYVVCNTGNCSIWIVFFRNNTDNIIQL